MAKASGLETILTQLMKSGALNSIGATVGADKDEIKSVLETAVPALLGSMAVNAEDKKGAKDLAKALDDHADTNVSLASMLANGIDMEDGAKIVSHLLGDKENSTAKAISKKSGVDLKKVASILAVVAPILMKVMGNAKQETGTGADGLGSLLGALLGAPATATASSKKEGNNIAGDLVGSLLGAALGGGNNNTGDLVGSLLGAALGGGNSKDDDDDNVLGSLLGAALGAGTAGNSKKDDNTAELVGSLLTAFLK